MQTRRRCRGVQIIYPKILMHFISDRVNPEYLDFGYPKYQITRYPIIFGSDTLDLAKIHMVFWSFHIQYGLWPIFRLDESGSWTEFFNRIFLDILRVKFIRKCKMSIFIYLLFFLTICKENIHKTCLFVFCLFFTRYSRDILI